MIILSGIMISSPTLFLSKKALEKKPNRDLVCESSKGRTKILNKGKPWLTQIIFYVMPFTVMSIYFIDPKIIDYFLILTFHYMLLNEHLFISMTFLGFLLFKNIFYIDLSLLFILFAGKRSPVKIATYLTLGFLVPAVLVCIHLWVLHCDFPRFFLNFKKRRLSY